MMKHVYCDVIASKRLARIFLTRGGKFNPILRGVFDQRILHGDRGQHAPPNLTRKPKVIRTPNLIRGWVFTKTF